MKVDDKAWEDHHLYLYIQANYGDFYKKVKALSEKSHGHKQKPFIRLELERELGFKFPSKRIAYRTIDYVLLHPENEKNQTVFPQYLNAHRHVLRGKIRKWVKEAEAEKKRITYKAIAERISKEGGLDIDVSKSQVNNIFCFCKDNEVLLPENGAVIMDVLNNHYEDVKKHTRDLFERFVSEGKEKGFSRQLREDLESFAATHSEDPTTWKFPENPSVFNRFLAVLLEDAGIERNKLEDAFVGFSAPTARTKFLRNTENSQFIEDLALRLAPDWFGGKKTRIQVGIAFEEAIGEKGEDASDNPKNGRSGVARLNKFFKQNEERLIRREVDGKLEYTLRLPL